MKNLLVLAMIIVSSSAFALSLISRLLHLSHSGDILHSQTARHSILSTSTQLARLQSTLTFNINDSDLDHQTALRRKEHPHHSVLYPFITFNCCLISWNFILDCFHLQPPESLVVVCPAHRLLVYLYHYLSPDNKPLRPHSVNGRSSQFSEL